MDILDGRIEGEGPLRCLPIRAHSFHILRFWGLQLQGFILRTESPLAEIRRKRKIGDKT